MPLKRLGGVEGKKCVYIRRKWELRKITKTYKKFFHCSVQTGRDTLIRFDMKRNLWLFFWDNEINCKEFPEVRCVFCFILHVLIFIKMILSLKKGVPSNLYLISPTKGKSIEQLSDVSSSVQQNNSEKCKSNFQRDMLPIFIENDYQEALYMNFVGFQHKKYRCVCKHKTDLGVSLYNKVFISILGSKVAEQHCGRWKCEGMNQFKQSWNELTLSFETSKVFLALYLKISKTWCSIFRVIYIIDSLWIANF